MIRDDRTDIRCSNTVGHLSECWAQTQQMKLKNRRTMHCNGSVMLLRYMSSLSPSSYTEAALYMQTWSCSARRDRQKISAASLADIPGKSNRKNAERTAHKSTKKFAMSMQTRRPQVNGSKCPKQRTGHSTIAGTVRANPYILIPCLSVGLLPHFFAVLLHCFLVSRLPCSRPTIDRSNHETLDQRIRTTMHAGQVDKFVNDR